MTRSLPSSRVVAAGFVIIALIIFGVTYLAFRASSRPAPSHVASLPTSTSTSTRTPASGRGSATLDVISGMPVLTIRTGNLGGTLLRVTTPDDAPVRPVLRGNEAKQAVQLSLASAHEADSHDQSGGTDQQQDSAYTVSVVLNSAVVWNLNLGGGTDKTIADLRGGRVSAVQITAGSDIVDLALPRPASGARAVPLRLAGGASQFLVTVPSGVPTRIAVGGAGEVTVDTRDWTGVAGGTLITPPDWATATARYDIDATAGVSRLLVRTR
ncbi:MAG: hypothetical protein JO345_18095 [Streptosporangiaceae bacterium]|nr:hypothetical protein [Streptosporangiaceae bacterium]